MSDNQLLIDFDWWRDPKGYDVVEKRLAKGARAVKYNDPGKSVPPLPTLEGQIGFVYHPLGVDILPSPMGSNPQRILQRVVRRGGKLQPWRPIDNIPDLYARFAVAVKDADSVLSFIKKYGPLTAEGLDPQNGELIDGVIVHAKTMNEVLYYARYDEGGAKALVEATGGLIPMADMEIALVLDRALTAPKLIIRPKSLLDGLWIQLAQNLSGNLKIRQCQHCGIWFETGHGKGRRLDAKFCSDEHRVAFNSLKRTKEK